MKTKGFTIGALLSALVLLVLGAVLQNQSSFSNNYVKSQLVAHGISFTPKEGLMPSQQQIKCLVKNAGKPLKTGKQAECYALYQIGIDLTVVDNGKTYFEDHYNGYLSRVKMYDALKADPNSPATLELVKISNRAYSIANDLLAGEATKGLLLTAYGFSILGERAGQAALACFVLAGVLLLAGIALFVRSQRKPALSASTV